MLAARNVYCVHEYASANNFDVIYLIYWRVKIRKHLIHGTMTNHAREDVLAPLNQYKDIHMLLLFFFYFSLFLRSDPWEMGREKVWDSSIGTVNFV